jgi:hypothetical protein
MLFRQLSECGISLFQPIDLSAAKLKSALSDAHRKAWIRFVGYRILPIRPDRRTVVGIVLSGGWPEGDAKTDRGGRAERRAQLAAAGIPSHHSVLLKILRALIRSVSFFSASWAYICGYEISIIDK